MAVSEDGSYAVPEPGEVLSFENIESDIKLDCQMVAKIPDKSDKEVGMGHRMLKFVKSVALPYSSRRQSVVENGVKYNIKHLSESFRWVRIDVAALFSCSSINFYCSTVDQQRGCVPTSLGCWSTIDQQGRTQEKENRLYQGLYRKISVERQPRDIVSGLLLG